MAGSRIVVEVAGDSASLLASVDKAADALKDLASVVGRTAKQAADSGAEIVKSNQRTGDSFAGVGTAAKDSSSTVAASVSYTTDSVAGSAAKIAASNDEIAASMAAVAAESSRSASVVAESQVRQDTAVAASATKAQGAAKKTEAAFGTSSSKLTSFGKTALVGIAAVALGSVYAAAKFQTATTQFTTQAGVGKKAAGELAKGILAMTGIVGQTPDELAGGMYHIASSLNNLIPPSKRVRTELGILKVAAEGAAVGNSNMTQTTYVLSALMNALGQKTIPGAKNSMAELNAIVGAGDMHMQDLVNAMSTGIVPMAKTFHVSLQSMGAALDVLADKGVPAQQAATKLRMGLTEMAAPTKMATGILQTLGLTSTQAISSSKNMTDLLEKAGVSTTKIATDLRQPDGILVALEDLKTHLEKSGLTATGAAATISRSFGGIRGATVIETLFQSMDKLHKKYQQIGTDTGQFGADWKDTQQTLTFQLHQIEGSFEALGVKIGDFLIPKVEAGITDLKDLVKWFDHNKTAAAALGGAVTLLASVAIGSYLTSKIRGATGLLKEFGGALGIKIPGASGSAGPASTTGAFGGIAGIRGTTMPGTAANPIVVAIESGQYAGLGGLSAASTTEGESASDVVAAKAAAPAAEVSVAESAGVAGLGSSVLGGLKGVLGKLLPAAVLAGGGTIAGDVVKQILGGRTGSDAATVVKDTGYGAAVGSVVPGVGTLAGAAGGAIVGALTDFFRGNTFGSQLTNSLNTAMARTRIVLPSTVANRVDKITGPAVTNNALPGLQAYYGKSPASLAQAAKQEQEQLAKTGPILAQALISAFKAAPKHLDLSFIEKDTKAEMDKLPGQARAGVDGMMAEFVQEMEKQGRLPEGSVSDFLTTIEGYFPGMKAAFAKAGTDSVAALTSSMDFTTATTQANTFIQQMAQTWEGLPTAAKLSSQNAATVFSQNLDFLHTTVKTTTGQTKTDALQNYQELQALAEQYFATMTTNINQKGLAQAKSLGDNTQKGKTVVATNFDRIASIISTEMQDGVISTRTGMSDINMYLDQELSKIGGSFGSAGKVPKVTVTPGIGPKSITGPPSAAVTTKAATGGLWQIGRAGDRGRDTIPLSVGGMNLVVGSGEQLAVLTRHQQATAASVGLFNDKTPHYMASGGPITPPSSGLSGEIGQVSQAAINKATAAANTLIGKFVSSFGGPGSGGSVGHFSGPWVSVMEAIAKQRGWSVSDWEKIINAESGGSSTARNPSSGAFGIGQFNPASGTLQEYAKYGSESTDPSQQIVAMAQYIADRYGNPTNAWAHEVADHSYAEGGAIAPVLKGVKLAVSAAVKKAKPGTHAKAVSHKLSPKAMSELSGTAGRVAAIEADLSQQSSTFTSQQSRFDADEAAAQYLNDDGSLNASGVAIKEQDDQALINIQQTMLGDYNALLPLVEHALSRFLGKDSKVESTIRTDVSQETANKARIKVNQEKVAEINKEILVLRKPSKNHVQAIENQIAQTRLKWDTIVGDARTAKAGYGGKNKNTKAALAAALLQDESNERNALAPLEGALLKAKIAQQHKKTTIASEIYGLDAQKMTLTDEDVRLGAKDSKLAVAVTGLKGVLSGANGGNSTNSAISNLETIAATLGTVMWSGGKFAGINTANQGGAYDTSTQIETLKNDIAATASEGAAATTADDSTLNQLLEQQLTTDSEQLALAQAQLGVLTGFIPALPHFAAGGPVLDTGPAVVHAGEYVVPSGGALVSGGGTSGPQHLHVNFNGDLGGLMGLIDSRVSHPQNVLKISQQLGRRSQAIPAWSGAR